MKQPPKTTSAALSSPRKVIPDSTAIPNTGLSDQALVQALLNGDKSAGEALVERSYKLIFRSLVKLTGDQDLAADLTQETFRRAWSSLQTFRGQSTFSSWLYRVAYTTHLNHLRRPQLVSPVGEADLPENSEAPDTASVRRQSEQRLRAAVAQLPERQRLAISAKFWGELSTTEIAALEQVSAVAIRKRIRKALTNLHQTMASDLSPLTAISCEGGTPS